MLAPLLHIFFDVKIFVASVDESVAYTATYIVVNVMLQNFLYGHVRWPWVSEIYEYVQGVFLSKAILSVVLSPRKPTFNVTAKGQTLDHDHLSRLAWPFVAVFALLSVGVATAAYRYAYEPGVTNLMLVVGLWASFNLVIAAAALGAVAERRQPDRHPRLAIDCPAEILVGGTVDPVQVVSVSATGCALNVSDAVADQVTGRESDVVVRLRLVRQDGARSPELVLKVARVDRKQAGRAELGCAFELSGYAGYREIVALMYGDAEAISAFLRSRRRHKSILAGTLQLLRWAATGPVQALSFALKERRRVAQLPATTSVSASATELVFIIAEAEAVAPAMSSAEPTATVETSASVAADAAPAHAPGPHASEWLWQMVALAQDELHSRAVAPDSIGFGLNAVEPASVATAPHRDDRTWMVALLGLSENAAVPDSRPEVGERVREAA